jgi:excisionase family DNA binding protein
MEDSFLTVAEVAELLKLNQQTVRNWIDRGELPAVRVGQRRVRVKRSDLDDFIEKGSVSQDRSAASASPLPTPEFGSGELWARLGNASAGLSEAIRRADRTEVAEALDGIATAARKRWRTR